MAGEAKKVQGSSVAVEPLGHDRFQIHDLGRGSQCLISEETPAGRADQRSGTKWSAAFIEVLRGLEGSAGATRLRVVVAKESRFSPASIGGNSWRRSILIEA